MMSATSFEVDTRFMAGQLGFEPRTPGFGVRCSAIKSYWPIGFSPLMSCSSHLPRGASKTDVALHAIAFRHCVQPKGQSGGTIRVGLFLIVKHFSYQNPNPRLAPWGLTRSAPTHRQVVRWLLDLFVNRVALKIRIVLLQLDTLRIVLFVFHRCVTTWWLTEISCLGALKRHDDAIPFDSC